MASNFLLTTKEHTAEYGFLVSLKFLANKLSTGEPVWYSPDSDIEENDVIAPIMAWAKKNGYSQDQLNGNCLCFIEQYINEDQVMTPHIFEPVF